MFAKFQVIKQFTPKLKLIKKFLTTFNLYKNGKFAVVTHILTVHVNLCLN